MAVVIDIPLVNEYLAHWQECLDVLPPAQPLKIRLPKTDVLVQRSDLETLRNTLDTRQKAVQARAGNLQMVRGDIFKKKLKFLEYFNEFTTCLDANFRNTIVYDLRPYAPSINAGPGVFADALGNMLVCWDEVNNGPAPAGVTLPLTLSDALTKDAFASLISQLAFAYASEKSKDGKLILARGARNETEGEIHTILGAYVEGVPDKMKDFPLLVDTVPRLSPLPGHTPDAVNATGVFVAPNQLKVVYDASTDPMLKGYQLRGNVGDSYNEDAVVIATHSPSDPREFIVPFNLNEPGAKVAVKLFVILNTGNEAGSAPMFVERPLSLAA